MEMKELGIEKLRRLEEGARAPGDKSKRQTGK